MGRTFRDDFGEDRVLLETERIVAAAVEATIGNAAEVADTGESDRDEAVGKFPHALATKRDLGADDHAFAELEVRDRLLRAAELGLLAGNRHEVVSELLLLVLGDDAEAHVDDDLLEAGNEHLVGRTELLFKLGNHAARIFVFKSCHDGQFLRLEGFAALDGDSELLAVLNFGLDARSALLVRIVRHKLAEADGHFLVDDAAGSILGATHGLLVDVDARNDGRTLLGIDAGDGTGLAGGSSAGDDDRVVLLDSCDSHC